MLYLSPITFWNTAYIKLSKSHLAKGVATTSTKPYLPQQFPIYSTVSTYTGILNHPVREQPPNILAGSTILFDTSIALCQSFPYCRVGSLPSLFLSLLYHTFLSLSIPFYTFLCSFFSPSPSLFSGFIVPYGSVLVNAFLYLLPIFLFSLLSHNSKVCPLTGLGRHSHFYLSILNSCTCVAAGLAGWGAGHRCRWRSCTPAIISNRYYYHR